jgi:hypothetical protein
VDSSIFQPSISVRPANLFNLQAGDVLITAKNPKEMFLMGSYPHPHGEGNADLRFAIFLEGVSKQFNCFALTGTRSSWSGFSYVGTRIEVNPTSAFNVRHRSPELGDVVRNGEDHLSVNTYIADTHDQFQATVAGSFDTSDLQVGFTRWRIVTGPIDKPVVVFLREATDGPAT